MNTARQGTIASIDEFRYRTGIARKALERWTKRLLGGLAKLGDADAQLAESERVELLARTLLSHLSAIPRGATKATLPDYSGDGTGTVEIALAPATGPRAVAERMLHEARKLRRGAAVIPVRKAAMETELEEAAAWERRIAQAWGVVDLGELDRVTESARSGSEDGEAARRFQVPSTSEPRRPRDASIRELLDELEARLMPRGLWPAPPRTREAEPERKPVRWTLEGGWLLMAGRSGTENDFLTTRIARPDDLWFHMANVPGAHVILRSPDGKAGAPPPERIEQAAALAAWLSRMRSQDRVEVRYTERRRVRKPRKAPAGTVVMEQSRSILVKPAPPPR